MLFGMGTNFFRTLKGKVGQRMLPASADLVYWTTDMYILPRPLVVVLVMYLAEYDERFEKPRTRYISCAFGVAQFRRVVQEKADEKRARFSGDSPGCNWKESRYEIGRPRGPLHAVYAYSTFQVLNA